MRVNQERDPDVTGGAEGPAARSVDSFLEAKLGHPPVRDNWVSRARLLDQLDLGTKRPIALIAAPAGYGKTTLVAQWLARPRQRTLAAWVSLDAGDNDPGRLWTHVAAALERVGCVVSADKVQVGADVMARRTARDRQCPGLDARGRRDPARRLPLRARAGLPQPGRAPPGEPAAAGTSRDHHAGRPRTSAGSDQGVRTAGGDSCRRSPLQCRGGLLAAGGRSTCGCRTTPCRCWSSAPRGGRPASTSPACRWRAGTIRTSSSGSSVAATASSATTSPKRC